MNHLGKILIAAVGVLGSALVTIPAATAAPQAVSSYCYMGGGPDQTRCYGTSQGRGTLAARLYEDANYGGSYLELYRNGGSCTSGTGDVEGTLKLGPLNFNDRITSVLTYNTCDVKLYGDPFPDTSPATDWINYTANLSPTWNDRANWLQIS